MTPQALVIIVDSSRGLSESEICRLFANCGEIIKIFPFSLPPNCLRDFPGLSQHFVEFSEEGAARQATELFLPPGVKVDPLFIAPELLPLFTSLRTNQAQTSTASKWRSSRLSVKKPLRYAHVAFVRCAKEYDESDMYSLFSTCGDLENVYLWHRTKSRKRRFFVEFTRVEDVENARKANFTGFEVLSLAQNIRWIKDYKKCAKLGRRALAVPSRGAKC